MAGSFSSQVLQFNAEAKENASLILRTAVDGLHKEIVRTKSSGGNLPFDTGNLGRSVEVSTVAFPEVDQEEREYSAPDVSFVLNGVEYGDPVYIGVRAVYGPRMNYGFVGDDSFVKKDGTVGRNYNVAGNYFVENAAAKWQIFVKEAEAQFGI